jgi:hypothetical protein
MPSRPTRGRRRERHVNVFVQEEAPKGRSVIEDDSEVAAAVAEESGENGTSNTAAVATARSRRLRAQRISRQVRARSDIFTRTQGAEMRKFAILSALIVAVMVALMFVLN